MSDNCPRDLDLTIAALLHINILGKIPCYLENDERTWSPSPDDQDTMQPFYHDGKRVRILSEYHLYDDLATQALEQVCDERKIDAALSYYGAAGWYVELANRADGERVARGEGDSLALAICKALAELT